MRSALRGVKASYIIESGISLPHIPGPRHETRISTQGFGISVPQLPPCIPRSFEGIGKR